MHDWHPPREGPITEARSRYDDEAWAHHTDEYEPWMEESRRHDEAVREFLQGPLASPAPVQESLFEMAS